MRHRLLVIGILFAGGSMALTQSPFSPSADPQDTGRIAGRVVAADTGAPLRGARVGAWSSDGQARLEAATDEDGKFELAQLPAGEYVVSATLDGYLGVAYGARQLLPADTGTPVVLEPGQAVEGIDITLPRAGVIVVRLTDQAGEPIAGAYVEIRRYGYRPDGQQRLMPVPTGIRGPTTTDDRGELRAFGLRPGSFTVLATVRTVRAAGATIASNRAEGFSRTYYPGTTSVTEAQFIALGTGDERTAEFSMAASPLRRISGSVVTSDGQPGAGLDLQLAPPEGDGGITSGAGKVAADGTFAIAGVADGAYTLQIRQNARPSFDDVRAGRFASPFAGLRGEFASVPVTVSGQDVTDLRIATGRGTTISGRVVFEGDSTPPPASERRVYALPPGLAGGGYAMGGSSVYDFPPEGGIAEDGAFQIAGASGRVQLDVPAADFMITSIVLDGRDITEDALDLAGTNTVSGIVVTMTDRLTALAGRVRDRDGQPARGSVVVVLPAAPAGAIGALRRIHMSRPDAGGRFEIRRLRPGRYLAAAVEAFEEGRQFAPEFQQRLRRGAREFSLGEGQTLTLDLELTPAP